MTDPYSADVAPFKEPLIEAMRANDLDKIIETVWGIYRVYGYSIGAHACLYTAIEHGHIWTLRLFLNYGYDPNIVVKVTEDICTTPLMYAITRDQYDCAKCLLLRGADPNMFYTSISSIFMAKLTPLLITLSKNVPETTKLLVKCGGAMDLRDYTTFKVIMRNGDRVGWFAVLESLFKRVNDIHNYPSPESPQGWTPETHHMYTFVRYYSPPSPRLPRNVGMTTIDSTAIHIDMSNCAESLLLISDATENRETLCAETPLEVYYDLLKELGWMSD